MHVLPHTPEDGANQKNQKTTGVRKDVEKWGHLCAVGRNRKRGTASMETIGRFLKEVKTELWRDKAHPSPHTCPEERTTGFQERFAQPWSEHDFHHRQSQRSPCPLKGEWIMDVWSTRAVECYPALKMIAKSDRYHSVNEPQGHCA